VLAVSGTKGTATNLGCSRAAWLLAFAGLVLLAPSVRAQTVGDYDGDGDVDGDDFWYWAGCMTGPAGSLPDPNCAAFDFDLSLGDGKVDLAGFAAFTVIFAPCTPGHWYAHVSKEDTATGCSARIRTRAVTLCGEPQNTAEAGSLAWAGVTKYVNGVPVKYAQVGYVRVRGYPVPSPVKRRVYAETRAGPNNLTDYEWWTDENEPNEPSEGTHVYKCYLTSPISGKWQFQYDSGNLHDYTHSGWVNELGTAYQWTAEIWNWRDQMVGTASAKCDFTECKFATNWQTFQDAEIGAGDLHSDDVNEWGIERISATGFQVWDKKPYAGG
jgi:hypothetical protein